MAQGSTGRTLLRTGGALLSVFLTRALLQNAEQRERNRGIGRGKRFLVLGGGFAGAAVAQELARLLHGPDNGDITLVDSDNYLLFTPMLTEAAGGAIEPRHIISPLRSLHPRVKFVQGTIKHIDAAAKTVKVEAGGRGLPVQTLSLSADHLVIALGSVVNYRDTPGVAEHAIGMKQLDDASAAFERVSACLENAAIEQNKTKRRELLTFVVGGGGYTGVESMAAINDFARQTARKFPGMQEGEVRTVLAHPGDRLMPEISPELSDYATEKLRKHGVEIIFNAGISEAGADYVQIQGGERIPTRMLIWAGGVMPNPLIDKVDAPKGKHRGLTVDGCCRVGGRPGVWALGDCAEIPEPDGKGTYAPTAQNATREGALVARNIVAVLRGEEPRPFRFTPLGELALVGHHSGVARVYGFNFSGLLAWAMWRAVYLAKMPNFAQQGRVLSDWVLDVLVGQSPVPLSTGAHRSTADRADAA